MTIQEIIARTNQELGFETIKLEDHHSITGTYDYTWEQSYFISFTDKSFSHPECQDDAPEILAKYLLEDWNQHQDIYYPSSYHLNWIHEKRYIIDHYYLVNKDTYQNTNGDTFSDQIYAMLDIVTTDANIYVHLINFAQ